MATNTTVSEVVDPLDPESLNGFRALTRSLRIHYEAFSETEVHANGSASEVGVDIRMWGAHSRDARPKPGCHLCTELHARMCELARWATVGCTELTWEVLPYSPALYWEEAQKADEVCVEFRGLIVDPSFGFAKAAQDECRKVRRRLEAAGVQQGSPDPTGR